MIKRIIGYGALALILFLLYQHAVIYIQGIGNNPYVTMYRNQTPYQAKTLPLERGEERVVDPCVAVKLIQRKASPAVLEDDQSASAYPMLLNRFSIRPTLDPLVAQLYLESDGTTSLEIQPDPRPVQLGRLREAGILAGIHSYDVENAADQWFVEGRYTQDLLRVGPVQSKLSGGIGYQNLEGFYIHLEVGLVVRF